MAHPVTISAKDALILVDVQNDFCPGGALAVPEGDQVVPVLNRLAALFDVVVGGRDWHPADHCSFQAQGGLWPVHCVIGTPGAEYHPDLDQTRITLHVTKASAQAPDTYNEFEGEPDLAAELRRRGVERVFVGGLATDYCVLNTVVAACERGFTTFAVTDAMRAVEVQPGDGEKALQQMAEAGATLVDSAQVSR